MSGKTPAAETGLTVAAHPRAAAQVRAARGWGGLLGFAATLVLSLRAGAAVDAAVARGLAVGVVMMLAAWAAAVTVWRHLLVAEIRARHAQRTHAAGPGNGA